MHWSHAMPILQIILQNRPKCAKIIITTNNDTFLMRLFQSAPSVFPPTQVLLHEDDRSDVPRDNLRIANPKERIQVFF